MTDLQEALITAGVCLVAVAIIIVIDQIIGRIRTRREARRARRDVHFDVLRSKTEAGFETLQQTLNRLAPPPIPSPLSRNTFARSAVVDHDKADLLIDGVRFPYWVAVDPSVENIEGLINVVHIGIQVDGPVTIINSGGRRSTTDPELGNIREWVRDMAQTMTERDLPWLRIDWTDPAGADTLTS